MLVGSHHSRHFRLVARAATALRSHGWLPQQLDPDAVRYVAGVSVWARWFVCLVVGFEFVYRPGFWYYGHFEYTLLLVPLVAGNGLVHSRLLAHHRVTWHWLFLLGALDITLATVGVIFQGGFQGFMFLAYYPALAVFAVAFTTLWLGLAWTTLVAGLYALICLLIGPGLDFVAGHEKELVVRLATMYTLVLCVGLCARFERLRWRAAVARERALQQERIERSQTIHDTTAQAAYMIGLGLDTAQAQAAAGHPALAATLAATARLARSTIWELRQPINMGGLYEGRDLGWALRAHAASFTNVTAVPAELTQTGVEPALSIEARGRLFSIAHNALTNAYRHAEASRVSVHLAFGAAGMRLAVSDDGAGLPKDYAERGRGFANMRRDAARLGGRLVVAARGALGGATVTCVIPAERGGEAEQDGSERTHPGAGR